MIRKLLLAIGVTIILAILGLAIYISTFGPALPAGTDETISRALTSELPELVRGETGYAEAGGVDIWYNAIEPEGASRGSILLLTGISSDAVAWPAKFLDALVDAGYQVVRYDHRGTGMSDWIESWDNRAPYTLEDMANDGVAVLDALDIERAHVVGVSMGGMVAQQLALDHPDRVLSLTSIMSSCHIVDPDLPPISREVATELIKVGIKYGLVKSERNLIKLHVAGHLILRGDASYPVDVQTLAEQVLYNVRRRKGYNSQASAQHNAAVMASGSRYEKLQTMQSPTLIIHGRSDPFIPIEHGMKCAELLPNVDTLWVEGMGHDLPDKFIDVTVGKMLAHFQQVE